MINARTLLLLSVLLLSMPTQAAQSDIAQRAQRVEVLSQQWPRPDDIPYAAAMRREYEAAFGDIDDAEHLRGESDEDLKLHWRAVENAAFYSADGDLADAAVRVFDELEKRGLADARATDRLFNFLLKARRFDAARTFAASHGQAGLPGVPRFIDAGSDGLPSVWRFDADGSRAERVGIDLQPLQIIVAAGCHFSADAAKDIAKDPVLGPVFERHAHWLSPQPGGEKLDALAEWNRSHPQTPMLAMHDRGEWTLIPQWVMPTFAIVKDGKVIDSTDGWDSTSPESRNQLVALLQRVGLLEADTQR